jgi:hypothetical protein
MSDIGEISYSLREFAREAFNRRGELGEQEIKDILEAAGHLASILKHLNQQREPARAA